jgi:hypothetical protein
MVMEMFHLIQYDERFLDSIIFSDDNTFHVSGKVNTRNCRIWGSQNLRVSLEHVRDSSKVNVFCALSKGIVFGPFFFMETTIVGIVYLDMLQLFLIPQLDEDDQEGRINFQQDSAPPHYLGKVREYRSDGRFWPVDLCCAVTLFCLSNNSDVEVILLLVPYVLPRPICLFLSLSLSLLFLSADETVKDTCREHSFPRSVDW